VLPLCVQDLGRSATGLGLTHLCSRRVLALASYFRRPRVGLAPLHLAMPSRKRRVLLARLLVEHGADTITQDNRKCTPLHLAAGNEIVDRAHLIEHGADPATRESCRSNPLHLAAKNGSTSLARLIEHGADGITQDNHGLTPCIWRWRMEVWVSHASSLSMVPTWQPRKKACRLAFGL